MTPKDIDAILSRAGAESAVDPTVVERAKRSILETLQPVRPLPPSWMIAAGLLTVLAAVSIVGAASLGAYGVHRGLLLPEGRFARRWWLWLIAASGALFIGSTVLIAILTTKGVAQRIWMDVGAFSFVLSCGTLCFAFLGIFVRFTTRSNRLMDSLSANSYGIYLVHYFFVAAIQYALLSQPLSGAAKAGVVVAGALAASWVTTAILRRIPLVSRLVGG